jgi:hypothetical protein
MSILIEKPFPFGIGQVALGFHRDWPRSPPWTTPTPRGSGLALGVALSRRKQVALPGVDDLLFFIPQDEIHPSFSHQGFPFFGGQITFGCGGVFRHHFFLLD